MDIRYPATIEKQEDGKYLVQFADLPDTFTEGDTLEEALFNASEALTGMLGFHVDEGHDLPAPSENVEGAYYIAPDAKTQAVLLLKLARGDRTLSDLARALETSWPQAQRLENPHRWPSLQTVDKAARVLGKRLVLSLE